METGARTQRMEGMVVSHDVINIRTSRDHEESPRLLHRILMLISKESP